MEETPFNDWRLVALTPLPSWALALLSIAAVAAVWMAWRGMASEAAGPRRRLLSLLRAIGAVIAVLLVLEPGIELLSTTRLRGRVAVLVDQSDSMSLPVKPQGISRAQQAQLFLAAEDRRQTEAQFQVEYDAFAESVRPTDINTLLSAGREGTPIERQEGLARTYMLPALEEVGRSGGGKPLAGVVLVSDGTDNGALAEAIDSGDEAKADDVKRRLKAIGAPVFVVDVAGGDLRDLAVSAVKVDDFAFVRSRIELEVELSQRGYGPLDVPVVLEREGQVVTSLQARVQDGAPTKVALSFTPDTTGEFAFTVRVPVQDGEPVTQNNARSFVLKVIRDRVRVLHVAGKPSWDERFMRQLLKRDPNVDLISFFILRTPSDLTMTAGNDELSLIPFPTDEIFRQQLKSFDLVIFHDFTYRPYRMSQYLPGIAEYVKDGGAFLMVGGSQSFTEGSYAGTALAEILPVELSRSSQPPTEEAFQARLTADGRHHPVTELAAGDGANDEAWRSLPALHGINRTTRKPAAHVLVEHPTIVDETGQAAPVVSLMEIGRGRSMAITADSTWMWAFYTAREGKTPRAYENFYRHAIRWLVRDPELTQVRVQAERERYAPSDSVSLTVKARSRDYGPANGARVTVDVVPAGVAGPSRHIEGVVSAEGTVRLELGTLPAGPWRATAVARANGEELGTAQDAFVVEEGGPELSRPMPRPDLLRLVAETTGGSVISADGAKWRDLHIPDPERVEIGQRKSEPMWDRLTVLLLLCAVLGSEWFLRRRWGFA